MDYLIERGVRDSDVFWINMHESYEDFSGLINLLYDASGGDLGAVRNRTNEFFKSRAVITAANMLNCSRKPFGAMIGICIEKKEKKKDKDNLDFGVN